MKLLNLFLVTSYLFWDNGFGVVEGSIAAEKDLSLSSSEKQALDKFKTIVGPTLTNDRFKSEVYLIRWLRAARFDMKRAERMLRENLRWRQEYKMDQIHSENWSEFENEFPYTIDSLDKEFQPVATAHMGKWDFRQAILSGRRNKMLRYIYKIVDDVDMRVQKQQAQGKLVTRGNIIIDVEGYNLMQHGCVQCIPLYLELISAVDNHYPELYDRIILVNVPSSFEALLNILKQTMSSTTKNALQVFGTNRRKWQSYLMDRIDEDELPTEYGGNKITHIDSYNDF